MSYSIEKKYWYLTKEGWIGGDFHYDTGGVNRREAPHEYVAKYVYIEKYSSAFDKNPTKKSECVEIKDKTLQTDLLLIHGDCPQSL